MVGYFLWMWVLVNFEVRWVLWWLMDWWRLWEVGRVILFFVRRWLWIRRMERMGVS